MFNFLALEGPKGSFTAFKLITLQPDGYTQQTPKETYQAVKTDDLNNTHAQLDLFQFTPVSVFL